MAQYFSLTRKKTAGGVVVDDADGRVFERAAESRFAVAEPFFGPFKVADILDNLDAVGRQFRRLTSALERNGNLGPNEAAVPADEPFRTLLGC